MCYSVLFHFTSLLVPILLILHGIVKTQGLSHAMFVICVYYRLLNCGVCSHRSRDCVYYKMYHKWFDGHKQLLIISLFHPIPYYK